MVEPVRLDFAATGPGGSPSSCRWGERGGFWRSWTARVGSTFLSGVPLDEASVQASSVTMTARASRSSHPEPAGHLRGGGGDRPPHLGGQSPPLDPGRSDRLPPGAPRPRPRPPPHRPRARPRSTAPRASSPSPPRRRRHHLGGAHRHPDPDATQVGDDSPPSRPALPPAPGLTAHRAPAGTSPPRAVLERIRWGRVDSPENLSPGVRYDSFSVTDPGVKQVSSHPALDATTGPRFEREGSEREASMPSMAPSGRSPEVATFTDPTYQNEVVKAAGMRSGMGWRRFLALRDGDRRESGRSRWRRGRRSSLRGRCG